MTSGRSLPASDLAGVLGSARDAFLTLQNSHIFLTGGTGFFGHWLLESLLLADKELRLNVRVTVLTRDPAAFQARSPHLAAHPAVTLLGGDVQSFPFPAQTYTHILHAATDSVVRTTEADLAVSILAGTQRILEFAKRQGTSSGMHAAAPTRLLYVSSGAVYGRGITRVATIPEDFPLPAAMSTPSNYDEAKRASEALSLAAASEKLQVSIARCFAFVGPHLPLDAHFAVGNFIRDALAGQPIHIRGDGTPLRSFLYMSDLAAWLWTMLALAPQAGVFNVGSDEAVSIGQLARLTAATLHPGLPIQIDGTPAPGATPATYVPDIALAERSLGLRVTVPLQEAIRRTAAWHQT